MSMRSPHGPKQPALAAWLRRLNDDPDPLHNDQTPAVLALGAMGLVAVPGLLERLLADSEPTRLHAQRALELVLGRRHGLEPGRGFPTAQAEAAMRAEWQANGNYDHQAPAARRAESVQRWQRWLADAGRP